MVVAPALRCAALLGLLAAAPVLAQDRADPKIRPPAAVSGFRYQLMAQRIHMNICEAEACTRGSKVSYLFAPPNPSPSFEQFRTERAAIAAALRKRAPAGTTITFAPLEQTKDKMFTIFKANRTEAYADGKTVHFLNWRLHGRHMTGEIISSSPSRKAAEQNLALFAIPVMVLMQQAKPGTGKDI